MAININQLRLGPEIPLLRRGCEIETSIGLTNLFAGTHFDKAQKVKSINKNELIGFILKKYPDYTSVLRNIYTKKTGQLDELIVNRLKEYNIITGELNVNTQLSKLGNLFECLVVYALHDLKIQSEREVKLIYPYDHKKYDPDGQKYDVIGSLDLTKFIWIECKKPLYINSSKLNNILDKRNISQFIKRAHLLRPTVAVLLVDTKEDYRDYLELLCLKGVIQNNLLTIFKDESSQIMGRYNGFIYFNRVDYGDNQTFIHKLKQSIKQCLFDARQDHLVLNNVH